MNKRVLWVIGLFGALVLLLAAGLGLNPREVPSPLVGKPAPNFELPLLQEPDKTFSAKQELGKVWLLNVWASWCVACREEHETLVAYSKSGGAPLYGLNYKDQRAEGMRWLARYGNPYRASFYDADGRVGIDYGVYGVPETYVIDKRGIIRYKRIGPVTPELLEKTLVPLVRELERE
ncbi:MAG TPA: DsbE family thiol:disulfide interchange protein [Burkholderiales bacterium]|nr:DsbE family thiol:disulfide interchange protein [Burkholderiales bacterium]